MRLAPAFSCRRRAVGVTLMELLTVISIVALLLVLLTNVLSKARDRGRTAFCLSNLRQLGSAVALYASDNRGYLPPRGVDGSYDADLAKWPGLPGYPPTKGAVWSDQNILGQYAGSTNGDNSTPEYFNRTVKPHSPFMCPADQLHVPDSNGLVFSSYGMGVNFTWASYHAANASYGYSHLWTMASASSPATMFVLSDCGDATMNGGAFSEPFPMYGTDDTAPNRSYSVIDPLGLHNWAKRHNGGGTNVLFLDGHAQFYNDLKVPYDQRELRMPVVDP